MMLGLGDGHTTCIYARMIFNALHLLLDNGYHAAIKLRGVPDCCIV